MIIAPIPRVIVPPIQSPIASAPGGFTLPFTSGLLMLLLTDAPHTDVDVNSLGIRVRSLHGGLTTQDQADDTRRLLWSATSPLGGRPSLSKGAAAAPFMRTASGLALVHPFVIYLVVAPPTGTPATLLFDGNSAGARALLANISVTQYQMGGASGAITVTHTVPAGGSLFTCIFDGASSELMINNVSVGTGTTATAAIDYIELLARFSDGNNWGGHMGAFGLQTGHPSAPNLSANNTAFMRWFAL